MSRNRNDSTRTSTPSAPSDSTRTTTSPAPSDSTATSSTPAPSTSSTSSTSSTTAAGATGSSTAASSGPSDTRKKFNAAFAKARREGKMTFTFNGKKYGTRRGSESKEDHAKKMRKAAGLPSSEELGKNIKEGEAAERRSNTQAARAAGIAGQAADDKRRKEDAAKNTQSKTESKPAAKTENKKSVNETTPQGKRVPEAGGRPESDARAAQRARVNFALEQRDKKKAARKAKRSAVRAAKSAARPGQTRRAEARANRQNRRAQIRDARRGGSTFQGGDGMKYGEKKKGKAGLKMVKNKDGKSVPFYAADGKGKMMGGGKYKMAYGGKLMGDGGNKVPVTNDRRAIKAGMEINYDDPFRYLSPSNRRAAEKMQKEGTLRITGPAGGFLDDATFDQISGSARRMKQEDLGNRSGRVSGKSGAAGSPKAKAPVTLRLAPPVGMPDPPRQGGGSDTRRGTVVGPGGSGTITIRGSQQDPSTRDNKVVIDKNTGRMSRN